MKTNQYDELFKDYDKGAAFDELAKRFYNRNFGTATKAEIELLMFHFYMDAMIKKWQKGDGTLNYDETSDYKMANQLGLTQTTVRNLKVKKQLRYPEKFDWMKSLKSVENNIRYENKKIIIPVRDINLLIEIRNFISDHGGYVEFESTHEVIKIRVEYYLQLMYDTLNDTEKKKTLKKLKATLKEENKYEDDLECIDKQQLITNFASITSSGLGAVSGIISMLSPQNTLVNILKIIINQVVKR